MSSTPDDGPVALPPRLLRIDRRLDRIERLMGLPPIEDLDQPARAVPPQGQDEPPPSQPYPTAPAPAESVVIDGAAQRRDAVRAFLHGRGGVAPTGVRRRADGTTAPQLNLERLIGGRFFAGLGALIVTLGVGYFLHLAYTWGWFRMSAELKCGLAGGFGALLLVAGEVARRRLGAAAAAGLSAAGIATLLIVSYAAHAVYELYGPTVAFALMAAAAAVGGAVAWGGASPLVGIVAVTGAYIAPTLLGYRQSHPGVVQAYLTIVLALGLWMSWALSPRSRWFTVVRTVAWLGTMLLGTVYCEGRGRDFPVTSLIFLAVSTLLIHAELALSAARADAEGRNTMRGWYGSGARMVLTSVASLSWCVALAVSMCGRHWPEMDWAPAAVAMAACLAGAIRLASPRELVSRPRSVSQALGCALAGQAGGLLIAAIALGVDGPARSAAWLALGVGAAVAGRLTRAVAVEAYAALLLLLGSARIAVEPLVGSSAIAEWWSIGALAFDARDTMLLSAGGAWLIAARVMVIGHAAAVRGMAAAAATVGVAHAMGVSAVVAGEANAGWIAPVWLIVGVLAAVAGKVERRLGLDLIGLGAVAMSLAPWAVEAVNTRSTWAGGPFTSPWMWTALAIGGSLVALSRWCIGSVPGAERRAIGIGASTLACIAAFIATSVEVSRSAAWLTDDLSVRGAALSVYWAIIGTGAVVAGFALRRDGVRGIPGVRYSGLALMTIAAFKALLIDLAGIGQVWRVVSFIAVGLLMIGVAVLYAKVSKAEREKAVADRYAGGS